MDKKSFSLISEVYPNLIDAELQQAEENLTRYLALILRIFDRIESETNPQTVRLTPEMGTLACTPQRSGPAKIITRIHPHE